MFPQINPNDPWYMAIALLIMAWTLPWKGWALWRAAQRSEKIWFVALLVLNTFGILEILYIFLFSKDKQPKVVAETEVKTV